MNAQHKAQLVELFYLFACQTKENQMKILAIAEAIANKDADEERLMKEYVNGKKDALQPIFDRYFPALEKELKARLIARKKKEGDA
ncbi:MAG: hypothetical protein IJ189_04010 [Clostridia bacterium]|nr:hypothetical protein [Clostridia bacterium]